MFISKKQYEEDLCKARREEADRYAACEERRRFKEEQRELELSMRGEIEELRRQLHDQKKEVFQAIDCVDRRVRGLEIRKAKEELVAERCRYVGRHEKA